MSKDESQRSSEGFSSAYQCHGYAVPSGERCPECRAQAPLNGSRPSEASPSTCGECGIGFHSHARTCSKWVYETMRTPEELRRMNEAPPGIDFAAIRASSREVLIERNIELSLELVKLRAARMQEARPLGGIQAELDICHGQLEARVEQVKSQRVEIKNLSRVLARERKRHIELLAEIASLESEARPDQRYVDFVHKLAGGNHEDRCDREGGGATCTCVVGAAADVVMGFAAKVSQRTDNAWICHDPVAHVSDCTCGADGVVRSRIDEEHRTGWRHGLRDALAECVRIKDENPIEQHCGAGWVEEALEQILAGKRIGRGEP